jgi:hypothetical protein
MWTRLILGLGVYEAFIIGLLQSNVASDSMLRILEQFPIVGLVIFTLYYVQKQQREDNRQTREWLEHMLQLQRENLKDAYGESHSFLTQILGQAEAKQNNMSDRIELLTQQIAVNTSTINEVAKVDSIISDLIDRLEKK